MKKQFQFATAAILLALLSTLSSCDKENALTGTGPVTIEFENRFGSDALTLGSNFTTGSGQTVNLSTFNYYVSNFVLVKDDGTEYTVPKDECYFLIRQDVDATHNLTLNNIPAGKYTGIKYVLGVDSLKNCADISQRTGDLDPASEAADMYWSWNSGYIFYKIEGTSPSAPFDSASSSNMFLFHIGGFGGFSSATMNNIKNISLTAPTAIEAGEGHAPEVHIYADAKEAFGTPNAIDLGTTTIVHWGPDSETISANTADMFSVHEVHND